MNELKHHDAFQDVLQDYQPSPAAQEILDQTQLVLLVGPSSSGRNTIINELVKTDRYHFVVSDTTRQPRENNGVREENGREYWFRSEDDMLSDLEAGLFLEAAIIHKQQVSGISIRELADAAKQDKIAINEVEVIGADAIYAAKPDTMFFFVLPPSFDEWMVRMRGRGELPPDETTRRLQSAVKEINRALERNYYQFIVNDTYMHASKHIDTMVMTNQRDAEKQAAARQVAAEILQDTEQYLASQ